MAPVKNYVGYIWIGDDPGIRLSILAESGEKAIAKVREQYGEGHVVSLWNEEDAKRPRSVTPDVVERYIPLLDAFANGMINAEAFQDQFLALWRDDRDSGRTTGEVLDTLMTGVDCFAEDPDVLYRIDAEQLRVEARRALDLLLS